MTQEELAARSGIGRVTISVIERGGRARLPTARELAKALSVEPAELMAK
jgi:transcriptional regulator with XRE-family HTH domain